MSGWCCQKNDEKLAWVVFGIATEIAVVSATAYVFQRNCQATSSNQ